MSSGSRLVVVLFLPLTLTLSFLPSRFSNSTYIYLLTEYIYSARAIRVSRNTDPFFLRIHTRGSLVAPKASALRGCFLCDMLFSAAANISKNTKNIYCCILLYRRSGIYIPYITYIYTIYIRNLTNFNLIIIITNRAYCSCLQAGAGNIS